MIKELLKTTAKNVMELVYPSTFSCLFCDEEIFVDNPPYICQKCLDNLPYNNHFCLKCGTNLDKDDNYCLRCKGKKFPYLMARSPFIYQEQIANSIKSSKFYGKKYYFETLAYFMKEEYIKSNMQADVIIPVPLHKDRLKMRGYNQSELLGKYLANYINVPLRSDCLIKIKQTKTQTDLNFKDRQDNLINAFKVLNKSELFGKSILLIDDVFTTGATVTNCANALLKAGVKEIFVLTLAHTNIQQQI